MKYRKDIWAQLKGLSKSELIRAVENAGWEREEKRGAILTYYHPDNPERRVSIHPHPGKTYGPKLLKDLLKDIGWSIEDLRRLKLIK